MGQSEPGCDGDEGILHTPQGSWNLIISYILVSYSEHLF